MVRNRTRLAAAAAALLLLAAGCGSSKSSATGGGTITIGILTDMTGPAASSAKTTPEGVKAGVVYAARNGYKIKYVIADSTTSPAAVLTAAQKLVEQDHVLAVIAVSAVAFGATQYLASQHIPVVGVAEDGPEWTTDTNMFSTYGAVHTNVVTTFVGNFLKMQGVTTVGAVGYSISPSSSQAAETSAQSAADAGIKVGYLNANFPFGSTNVGPEAIAMKNAGVNGLVPTVDPNTGFALITALRQAGVTLKAALLPTGYGGDLLQAGPGALQAAQGVFFETTFEPIEVNDAATQQFQSDLRAAGITNIPTYAEYSGYTSVGLLVQGLKAAGANPTRASLLAGLSTIHNWNALGLYGGRTLDINNRADPELSPGGSCAWFVKLVNNNFQLVPGGDPICGTTTGQTVK